MPLGTTKEEIAERLSLYDQVRHERATKIQTFSRIIGSDDLQKNNLDMFGFTLFNFTHDEFHNSEQKLREFQWAKIPNKYWRMPIAFGPMPGPRQDHFGHPRSGEQSTFTTASIRFKTSKTLLMNLFPPGRAGYKFTAPGTIAYASYSQTTLNNLEWLGGSGYKHIGLYVHGVQYQKEDGTTVNGAYLPILFENMTDPILSGREELGFPKVYSDISAYRRKASYHIKTSWQGADWGSFHLTGLKEIDPAAATASAPPAQARPPPGPPGPPGPPRGPPPAQPDTGIIIHKYIPKTGSKSKGEAEVDAACFEAFADAIPPPKTTRTWKAETAKFEIDGMSWDELPTLHHVIGRLAELPVYEIMEAKVVEGTGVPDLRGAKPV